MNVLKKQKQNDVLALVRAKISFREIEERLGIRRETASKYALAAGLWTPPSKPATPYGVATGSEFKTGQIPRMAPHQIQIQLRLKFPPTPARPVSLIVRSSSPRSGSAATPRRFFRTSWIATRSLIATTA